MKVSAERAYDDYRLRSGTESASHVDGAGGSKPVEPERQAEFAQALESSQARYRQGGSLREQIERLAQPAASDPSLYANERSIELLQHVVENVLPGMEADAEVIDMAAQVINEEIGQRLEWSARQAEAEEGRP